ncbi:hypothetical protein BGZ98_000622 [Dissophora globulifera]|nr:hypothetical protein BGZ98_000622 [Dissophora globulifera]
MLTQEQQEYINKVDIDPKLVKRTSRFSELKIVNEAEAAVLDKKNGGTVSSPLETVEPSMDTPVPMRGEMRDSTKTGIDSAVLTFQEQIALYLDQALRYNFPG